MLIQNESSDEKQIPPLDYYVLIQFEFYYKNEELIEQHFNSLSKEKHQTVVDKLNKIETWNRRGN